MTTDLKSMLEESIARAEREIISCRKELDGGRGINELHRNLFLHITQASPNIEYFFDDNDPEYQRLRDTARAIAEERAKELDSICRKKLDVEDMKRKFQQEIAKEGDNCGIYSSNLRRLEEGKLITGGELTNYASLLACHDGSTNRLEAVSRVNEETLNSESRRTSVLKEIELYKEYASLCKKRIDALYSKT